MEETTQVDIHTGLRVRIGTGVRKFYRESAPETYGSMRNAKLNEVIAKDFLSYSAYILHHFPLTKKGKREIGEIRGNSGQFFISAIRDNYIDILATVGSWKGSKRPIKERSKLVL